MSIDVEAVRRALREPVAELGLELYDVELAGAGRAPVLRVSVQDPGRGVDLERLTVANRALGPVVDELVAQRYELEVSSPGIERPLRRREHFEGAIGDTVSVKHAATPDGQAVRERGRLLEAGSDAVVVEIDGGERRTISYSAIGAARTVFDWGSPKPPRRVRTGGQARAKEHTKR